MVDMDSRALFSVDHSITWALSGIFYAFQMALRVMPVVMLDYLAQKVGFNAGELGLLAGIYYIGYCIAHIPIGIALDYMQPRYIIAACVLLCVEGLYLTGAATSSFEIFFARFLIGIGSAGGILGAIKVTQDYYKHIFGVMLGFTISIGIVGAYYGAEPIRHLLQELSYEQAIQGLVLFGIMLAASIFAFYAQRHDIGQNTISMWKSLTIAIQHKQLWRIGIFAGLMVGPIEGFADLWGSNYLSQIHLLSSKQAGFAITLIFIGLGIGSPLFGYLNKYIDSTSRIIAYLGILMLLCLGILFGFDQLSKNVVYAICFMIGLLSSYQILAFIMLSNNLLNGGFMISMALLNMVIMLFGFIYHSIIGFVLDTFFISSTVDALVYGADAYQAAFSVIVAGVAIGVVGFWRVKEK